MEQATDLQKHHFTQMMTHIDENVKKKYFVDWLVELKNQPNWRTMIHVELRNDSCSTFQTMYISSWLISYICQTDPRFPFLTEQLHIHWLILLPLFAALLFDCKLSIKLHLKSNFFLKIGSCHIRSNYT